MEKAFFEQLDLWPGGMLVFIIHVDHIAPPLARRWQRPHRPQIFAGNCRSFLPLGVVDGSFSWFDVTRGAGFDLDGAEYVSNPNR